LNDAEAGDQPFAPSVVRSLLAGLGLAGLMVVLPTGDDGADAVARTPLDVRASGSAVLGTVAIAAVPKRELGHTGPIRT
jgi:hypothetical protein